MPLTVLVEPDYDALKDPAALLPLVTCDTCFDLRHTGVLFHDELIRLLGEVAILEFALHPDVKRLADNRRTTQRLAVDVTQWLKKIQPRKWNLSLGFFPRYYGSPMNWPNRIESLFDRIEKTIQRAG